MLDRYEITDDWMGMYATQLREQIAWPVLLVAIGLAAWLLWRRYQTPGSKRQRTRSE